MVKGDQIKSEELQIQGVIDRFLKFQISANKLTIEGNHLDEDSLTAFVEGNLGQRETNPVVSHLVDCNFCRHKTVELVKLEMAFADEEVEYTAKESQPSKVSEVLSSLLTRIFGNNEGAVFAHQEKEEETKNTKDTEEDK